MIVIGLTGGIASGKSTIAKELCLLGLPVFDADEVSREAVAKGSMGLKMVKEVFGREYITADGEMDRIKISKLVFNNKEALKTLEHIIHKFVWDKAENFLEECRKNKSAVVILDVPLLIECNWHTKVDYVWLVSINVEEQVKRAMIRSNISEEEVRKRIAAQMPLEEKKKFADVIFDNSGNIEDTLACVHKAVKNVLGERVGS